MDYTYKIRNKPIASLILGEKKFEIVDSAEPKNNGIYIIKNLKSIKVVEKKTDWFVTTLSFVVSIFTGGGPTGPFRNQAYLNIELSNKSLKIWLPEENLSSAKKIEQLLNENTLD